MLSIMYIRQRRWPRDISPFMGYKVWLSTLFASTSDQRSSESFQTPGNASETRVGFTVWSVITCIRCKNLTVASQTSHIALSSSLHARIELFFCQCTPGVVDGYGVGHDKAGYLCHLWAWASGRLEDVWMDRNAADGCESGTMTTGRLSGVLENWAFVDMVST